MAILFGAILLIAQQGVLNTYRLEMDPVLLDSLSSHPYSDYHFPASIETEFGTSDCVAGFRGNTSLVYPKKSWKIQLSDHSLMNCSHILLDAQYSDISMMRNALSLYLTRQLGRPASLTEHVELYINDQYYGVYTQVERVDDFFYARNNLNDGHLFKAVESAARFIWQPADTLGTTGFEPRQGSDEHLPKVQQLIDALNLNSAVSINSDDYLAYVAVSVAIADRDAISKNFYLFLSNNDEWRFFPWDRDATLGNLVGGEYDSLWAESAQLYNFSKTAPNSRMFLVEDCRDLFDSYLLYTADIMVHELPLVIDSIYREIQESVYADPFKSCTNDEFDRAVSVMRSDVVKRGLFLPEMSGSFKALQVNNMTLSKWDFEQSYDSDSVTVFVEFAEPAAFSFLNFWTDGVTKNFTDMHCIDNIGYNWSLTVAFPADFDHLHFSVTYVAQMVSGQSVAAFSYPFSGSAHPCRHISAPTARRSSCELNPDSLQILSPVLYTPFVWSIPIINNSNTAQDFSFCGFQTGNPSARLHAGADIVLLPGDTLFLTNSKRVLEQLYPVNNVLGDLVTESPSGTSFELLFPSWETAISLTLEESTAFCQSDISLNELMSFNDTTVVDNYGDFDDFVEVVNSGSLEINLEGYFLTDNPKFPFKFAFPDTIIQPGDHFLVWADNETEQGIMHAGFNLNSEGETIYLLYSLNLVEMVEIPMLGVDVSYGRWPDTSGEWEILSTATPGAVNEGYTGDYEELYINTANPLFTNGVITFRSPQGLALLEVYDLSGRVVERIFEQLTRSEESVNWEISSLTTGIYFLRLSSHGESVVQKITVIK